MMLRTKSLLAALVCGMAGVVCMPAAFGNDVKVLPGAACIAQLGTQQVDMQYTTNGQILNGKNNEARDVICPVVRDSSGSYELIDVDMNVNAPYQKTVSCWIFSKNALATSVSYDHNSVTSGGAQTLDIGEPATSWTDGYYYVECTLDYTASVLSYRVEESTL